jgi:hypothetical protein
LHYLREKFINYIKNGIGTPDIYSLMGAKYEYDYQERDFVDF